MKQSLSDCIGHTLCNTERLVRHIWAGHADKSHKVLLCNAHLSHCHVRERCIEGMFDKFRKWLQVFLCHRLIIEQLFPYETMSRTSPSCPEGLPEGVLLDDKKL